MRENEPPAREPRERRGMPTRAQQAGLFLVLTGLAIYVVTRAYAG